MILFCIYLDLVIYADKPANKDPAKSTINITRGQSFLTTSESLHQTGLIKQPFKFRLIARLKGFDKQIQAGEYLLSSSMSPNDILEALVHGKVNLYKITIPEGLNIYQIATLMEAAGFTTRADIVSAANDPAFVQEQGIAAETFEGYLFPDTYHFPKQTTPKKIISTMVARFWSVFTSKYKARAQELGFTIHEVVTLASIIEKETGVAHERPIISSVFHNRLKYGMRLDSDPTVIYGIKNFDGDLTRKHLTTPTPYNTYKIKGLPRGPIASPGIAAIRAALFPADTDYLFFVSKKDTTHKFSKNLKDHQRAIRKYQLHR